MTLLNGSVKKSLRDFRPPALYFEKGILFAADDIYLMVPSLLRIFFAKYIKNNLLAQAMIENITIEALRLLGMGTNRIWA